MFWLSLIFLGLAIVAWQSAQQVADPVIQVLRYLFVLGFFVTGIIIAPLLLRSLMLVLGIVTSPQCLARTRLNQTPNCTGPCFLRWQCRIAWKQPFPQAHGSQSTSFALKETTLPHRHRYRLPTKFDSRR